MALWLPTATPPVWPRKHSRGYYSTTHQTQRMMRRFTRHHVPRSNIVPPAQFAIWHARHSTVNKLYLALVRQWWAAGAAPMGQNWWRNLATTVQIETYPGILKTVTGSRLFTWFQRRSLQAEGWFQGPYSASPTYAIWTPWTPNIPYPDHPRLPWNPQPAPTGLRFENYWPDYLLLYYIVGDNRDDWTARGLISAHPPPLASTRNPHYLYGYSDNSFEMPFPYESMYGIKLPPLSPQLREHRRCRLGVFTFDPDTRQPSPTSWIPATT